MKLVCFDFCMRLLGLRRYLDMICHLPDRTNISKEEFDKKLTEIMRTESWIIDGNYGRTIEMRMKYCDTVFLLDYPLFKSRDDANRYLETGI